MFFNEDRSNYGIFEYFRGLQDIHEFVKYDLFDYKRIIKKRNYLLKKQIFIGAMILGFQDTIYVDIWKNKLSSKFDEIFENLNDISKRKVYRYIKSSIDKICDECLEMLYINFSQGEIDERIDKGLEQIYIN